MSHNNGPEIALPTTPPDTVDGVPAQVDNADHVAELPKLEPGIERNNNGEVMTVSPYGTKTTDARLVHLKGLINLQSLS